MNADAFLKHLDEGRIVSAIQQAERRTTGEIRVCVASQPAPEPMVAARRAFTRLGMAYTADRNGVLILLAPEGQTFAVIGDSGIHDHCGDAFWSGVVDDLAAAFAQGRPAEGLEAAIALIADRLARHFPKTPGDTNELPDRIVRG